MISLKDGQRLIASTTLTLASSVFLYLPSGWADPQAQNPCLSPENIGACEASGLCTFDPLVQKCIAATNVDCRRSRECEGTHCIAKNGECVDLGSTNECQTSNECYHEGRCTWSNGTCIAASRDDCAQAHFNREETLCEKYGKCTPQGGVCVSTSEDCLKSTYCKQFAGCTPMGGTCGLGSTVDCRRTQGFIATHGGLQPCAGDGLCNWSPKREKCVALTDADCKQSSECKNSGACSVTNQGTCTLGSSFGCSQLDACKKDGQCTYKRGACVFESTADCRKTEACTNNGLCTYHLGQCVAATDSDCTVMCRKKNLGKCKAQNGQCAFVAQVLSAKEGEKAFADAMRLRHELGIRPWSE